jgi:CheY-like chemotaxis protein
MVDREQLEHGVLNLVANARDAMPRGGRLAIRIEKVRGDRPAIVHLGGNARDEVIALTVTDSGTGMTREVREKIFERFFTTKEPGRGTGLGLATAHRFVTGCGGAIDVRSEPGKGTTVAIYLPAAAPDTSARPVQTRRPTPRGTETVLVVEDDKHVREVIRLVLEQAGYRVLATGSGEDALRASTAHEGAIHLVIADVVMPEMNGRAVVEALRSARPGLRALYVSGHTDEALARAGSGISPLLRKAFSPSDLEVEVRRILDVAA